MTPTVVWAIGLGQCISWGVLYYAFGVLVIPLEEDLGVSRWWVTGAFSIALLTSALAAPSIGRWTDRGKGPVLMQSGGWLAAILLAIWAVSPSLWLTYLVWAGLGVCMAAVLYEPVFAQVGRMVLDKAARIRAIATITILGGLASTVALPSTAWLVEHIGWRPAVGVLATSLLIVTVAINRRAFPWPSAPDSAGSVCASAEPLQRRELVPVVHIGPLIATFACSSFASAALATNLVPALIDRQLSATTAAALAGTFGVMQLPGRLLVMNGKMSLSPTQLVWASLVLQIAGLVSLAAGRGAWSVVSGVSLFACGSGLVTVARPYLVLVLYGADQAGHINGVIARGQQLARAAAPVLAASVATVIGYGGVFVLMAGMLIGAGMATRSKVERIATNRSGSA